MRAGKIINWNPKAESLLGWKQNEVLGKLLSEIIIPERFREAHKKGMEHFLRTGEGPILGKILELQALKKDGKEIDIALNIAASAARSDHILFIGFIRDITGRKIAEAKFKSLLDSAPDAMIITNDKGEMVLINQQTENLFGYTRGDLIGKPIEILVPPEFRDKHVINRAQYFASPRARSMGAGLELFGIKKDGTRFPVEISLSPLVAEEGTLISASIRDITLRKQEEERLNNVKKDFQLLVSSVRDYAIYMIDKTGHVATWNSGAENIKGYAAGEIIGKHISIFYTPEDIRSDEPKKTLRLALQYGHYETENWRVRKDGSLIFANVTLTALKDEKGNHYGYAKVTKDITEKRKSEERIRFLALIADSILDPVISSDNDFKITRWNNAAEKLLGWKSEEVMGKLSNEILKVEYPGETREEILRSFTANGYWQGEVIYHTKSGIPLNVLSTASQMKDADGNTTGNLILARDITDRKNAEAALNKLNAELEQRVKERTEELAFSELRFRSLIENSGEGIAMTDEFANVIYRSPSTKKITGILPKENTISRTHPEDMEMIKNKRDETLKNPGIPIPFEGRFLHADGHYFWMEGTFTNLLHIEGVNAIVANYRDITKRKEAENIVAETLKEKNIILESIADAFFAVDNKMDRHLLEQDRRKRFKSTQGGNNWEKFMGDIFRQY